MANILPDSYTVSSSGTRGNPAKFHSSEPFTKAIAKENSLTVGITPPPTKLNDSALKDADIIVFLHKDVHDEAIREHVIDGRKTIVWDVTDMPTRPHTLYEQTGDVGVFRPTALRTFRKIQRDCDALLDYITAGSWVDVVDEHNIESGLRLPIAWVTDRGLWHRGIHVVLQTTDGKFLVGKRARSMIFAPGMLEISLGGAVDTGETPLCAAIRESHEETGVRVPARHFSPLFVQRTANYHPHYKKLTRSHIYIYTAHLPLHSLHFKPQPGEVDELRLVTRREIKLLLHNARLANFGRLGPGHKLYQKAVAMSTLPF